MPGFSSHILFQWTFCDSQCAKAIRNYFESDEVDLEYVKISTLKINKYTIPNE